MMKWPVIYIHRHIDEELMKITYDDWYHNVDSRHAVGPINDKEHYFVDSHSDVYRMKKGTDDKIIPSIEVGENVQAPELLKLVIERALKWNNISSQKIPEIIARLEEY